jgi:hypothetical protein
MIGVGWLSFIVIWLFFFAQDYNAYQKTSPSSSSPWRRQEAPRRSSGCLSGGIMIEPK